MERSVVGEEMSKRDREWNQESEEKEDSEAQGDGDEKR